MANLYKITLDDSSEYYSVSTSYAMAVHAVSENLGEENFTSRFTIEFIEENVAVDNE